MPHLFHPDAPGNSRINAHAEIPMSEARFLSAFSVLVAYLVCRQAERSHVQQALGLQDRRAAMKCLMGAFLNAPPAECLSSPLLSSYM